MQKICIEESAFCALIENVLATVHQDVQQKEDRWICTAEAMLILKIASKTTLQKLRDDGKIRASQPSKRMVLYDRYSIIDYLDDFAYETFDLE